MASVNKVIIVGNIGKDPEVRYTADNKAITSISVATSENYTDKSTGEKKEITEWHRIVFFNRLAEIAGEYLKKGSSVYVEGKLKTRKWTDQSGAERFTTEIIAEQLQMLGGRASGEAQSTGASAYAKENQGSASAPHQSTVVEDDDTPF